MNAGYRIEFHSHAAAIFGADFPEALTEIEDVLLEFSIPVTELVGSGGGETKGTQRLRRSLARKGWKKHNFVVARTIDGKQRESISHQVDHVRSLGNGVLGLEIEWNNKDPFFDRDLENFKRLHADAAISAGVVVTRGEDLQRELRTLITRFATENGIDSPRALAEFGIERTPRQHAEVEKRVRAGRSYLEAWVDHFCSDKFGTATTHWGKLQDRVRRGVGNPCPLLLIGIPAAAIR